MKRIFASTVAGLFMCLLSTIGHSQIAHVDVSYSDSCSSGGISYLLSRVTYTSGNDLKSWHVETIFGDGSKPDTASMHWQYSTYYYKYYAEPAKHKYSAPGTYAITHVLLDTNNVRVDTFTSFHTINCSYFAGSIYNDANANCVFENSETVVDGYPTIAIDSAGVIIDTLTVYNGQWSYQPLATSTTAYKFKLNSIPVGDSVLCPSGGLFAVTYNPTSPPTKGLDFAMTCSVVPAFDYSLLLYTREFYGVSSTKRSFFYLYAQNTSCHSASSTVSLNVSPKYDIDTTLISPTPASITGNTITWNLPGLPFRSIRLFVGLKPVSTTVVGDTVCISAVITPLSSDVNTANNYLSICDSVLTSPTVSVGTPAVHHDIVVFPNPAVDVLHVNVTGTISTEAVLINTIGQVVARQKLGSGKNELQVAQLPPGLYMLLVQGEEGGFLQKIEKR